MLSQIIVNICEKAGIETESKRIVATKWWLLSQLHKELCNDKPTLRRGTVPFLFIFVVLRS